MKKLITICVLAAMASVAYALPSDDFNDNSMNTSLWSLYQESPNVWLDETNERLEVRSTGDVNEDNAIYFANGWGFSATGNFSFKTDFHNLRSGPSDSFAGATLCLFKDWSNNLIIEADYEPNNDIPSYFHYELEIAGSTIDEKDKERDSDNGTLYISYDASKDEIYLSDTGYGATNAWVTIPGLLKGEWGSAAVKPCLGSGVENRALASGDDYFDNFVVDSGTIVLICEYALAGDLNNDCKVDFYDLRTFTEQWLQPAGSANLDNINGIDLFDFVLLAKNWLIDRWTDPENPACVPSQPVETFSRNSTAYLGATEYAANVKRTQDVLLVSTSDGAVRLGEGDGGSDIVPQCIVGSIMYGISSDYKIHRTTDGVTWTMIAGTGNNGCLYPTINGNLLKVNNDDQHIYRSTDGGVSFTDVYTTIGPSAAYFLPWSYAKNSTTMMLCEYGTGTSSGRYVYKSTDDGATWSVSLDVNTLPTGFTHIHTIGYHAGTGRWLVGIGDLASYRKVVYSTDDGANWSMLYADKNCHIVPVCFVDYGDSSKMFFADDNHFGFALLDVTTGIVNAISPLFDRRGVMGYSFSVAYYNGLYYGCQYSNASKAALDPAIYVSPDLVNWSVYHRFAASDGILGPLQFIGYLGGKLHWQVTSKSVVRKHFAISPAIVSLVTGSVITPGVTNLRNTADLSSFETSATLASSDPNWTISRVTDQHYHGSACVKVTGIDNDIAPSKAMYTSPIALTAGTSYVYEFVVKAAVQTTMYLRWYVCSFTSAPTATISSISGSGSIVSAVTSEAHTFVVGDTLAITNTTNYNETERKVATVANNTHFTYLSAKTGATSTGTATQTAGYVNAINENSVPVDSTWRKVTSYPYTVPAGKGGNYRLYIGTVQGPVAQTIYVDCMQLKVLPVAEWQIGGTNSVSDVLTQSVITPATFTNSFAVQTLAMIPHYGAASNLYIKTWKYSATDYVSLYFNPSDYKFYIQRTISGSGQTAIATTAQFWQPNAILKFAFWSGSGGISLTIQNGRAVETITNYAITAINCAAITMIYGDVDSANQFSGIYADEKFIIPLPVKE